MRLSEDYPVGKTTCEIWPTDCSKSVAGRRWARTRLIGLSSAILSCVRAGAVYTITSELSAKT